MTTLPPVSPPLPRWASARWRRVATIILLAIVLVEGFVTVFVHRATAGDIAVHYELGRAILRGDDAATNSNTKYLLGRHLLSAGVALLPLRAARGVYYLAAIVLTTGTWLIWRYLAERWGGLDTGAPATAAAALAGAGLLLPWLLRDLDECGLQLILLFFLSAAGLALATGRRAMTGFWLGLAITWKTVPLLFLPLLLWKRRFREALWTLIFVIFFNVAFPAAVLGPGRTARYYHRALAVLRQARGGDELTLGNEENPKPQNQGLQMAMVRFLVRYPPDHLYFKEVRDFLPTHPLFFQPGNLSPSVARRVSLAALLLLGGLLAWRMRHRWDDGARRSDLAPQWAAVTALTALLSPLCWLQHLVLLWPAAFLVLRRMLLTKPTKPLLAAIGFVALCTLVLQRGVLRRKLTIVVLSYHLPTAAALVLVALVLLPPVSDAPGWTAPRRTRMAWAKTPKTIDTRKP